MRERFHATFGPLRVSAGWNGNHTPSIDALTEPGFLRVTDVATGRVVHDRTDMLARRIGWIFAFAEKHPELLADWNCFCTVLLAAGKSAQMMFSSLPDERGTRTDDLLAVAREHGETPFIFDSIAWRQSVGSVGPAHTGIVLGYDAVKNDAIVFAKSGEHTPDIRYWTEIEQELRPDAQYTTWMPMEALTND